MSWRDQFSPNRQTRMSRKIAKEIPSLSERGAYQSTTTSETHENLQKTDDQYTAVEIMLQKAKALASDLNNKVYTLQFFTLKYIRTIRINPSILFIVYCTLYVYIDYIRG